MDAYQVAAAFEANHARSLAMAAVVVTTTAARIKARAQTNAPVDTGFLRNSAQYRSSGLRGTVAFTADYAIYQELGTSRVPGRHFLGSAVEAEAPAFHAAIAQAVKTSWQ